MRSKGNNFIRCNLLCVDAHFVTSHTLSTIVSIGYSVRLPDKYCGLIHS